MSRTDPVMRPPLGTSGDLRRRLVRHHLPLAAGSVLAVLVFMYVPAFNANAYPHADMHAGVFPQQRADGSMGSMRHDEAGAGAMHHRPGSAEPMRHGDSGAVTHGRGGRPSTRHDQPSRDPMRHDERSPNERRHDSQAGGTTGDTAERTSQPESPQPERHRSFNRGFTFASGYVALGLLGLTLLIGPANLLMGRRTPISNYLSRDVGTWAAIGSVLHTIYGLQVHAGGRLRDFLNYFVATDGSLLTNSFGLANWTGLAGLVIVLGLLAISTDVALRKLKARRWKRLQRLNYALFGLVIVHAFFYGAFLRKTSPYTILLALTAIAVLIGQAAGIRVWLRRNAPVAVSGHEGGVKGAFDDA